MTQLTDSLGRIALVVVAVLVAVPIVGGVLAGVWRIVTWGAVSGHSGYGTVPMHGGTMPYHEPMWDGGGGWMSASPAVGGVNVALGLPLVTLVGWAAFLAAAFGAAYLLYARFGPETTARDPAVDELRAAYARGDLTDEEFERRRDVLAAEDYERRHDVLDGGPRTGDAN